MRGKIYQLVRVESGWDWEESRHIETEVLVLKVRDVSDALGMAAEHNKKYGTSTRYYCVCPEDYRLCTKRTLDS